MSENENAQRNDELAVVIDALATQMARDLFDGRFPENPAGVAWAMTKCLLEIFPETSVQTIERFADELIVALSHKLAIQRDRLH
jgi:hypothetical protein